MQVQFTSQSNNDNEYVLFSERRLIYGLGPVVLTGSMCDGVALLEQSPESPSTSREIHAIIPLTSVEAIKRLEAFLAAAKKQIRVHEQLMKQRQAGNNYA
jgi:hypothetical protein